MNEHAGDVGGFVNSCTRTWW